MEFALTALLPLDIVRSIGFDAAGYVLVIFILLLFSGLFSSSEVTFFSLNPAQLSELKKNPSGPHTMILQLLQRPKKLLATLLISNNLVNVAIVILASLAVMKIFDFSSVPVLGFAIEVIIVTFLIVLLGEVMPKIYATHKTLSLARLVVYPVYVANKLMTPFSYLLVRWTAAVDKRIARRGYHATIDDLTHAIDLASDKNTPADEKMILKSIVKFGDIEVGQVMRPRVDVIGFDETLTFSAILEKVEEHGYSRIPVYRDSFDTVIGMLYTKDLLPYLEKDNSFNWQTLLRKPYFVPENKKISNLLDEFQIKKIHMAIVIDEYGTGLGIVSLEDILEEIVGEISDEFDDEEPFYSKLDDDNYVFEAKTSVNDVCRIMNIDNKVFGKAHNLAVFILEISGKIPTLNEVIEHKNMRFTIESSDKRRIKRVKVTRVPNANKEDTE